MRDRVFLFFIGTLFGAALALFPALLLLILVRIFRITPYGYSLVIGLTIAGIAWIVGRTRRKDIDVTTGVLAGICAWTFSLGARTGIIACGVAFAAATISIVVSRKRKRRRLTSIRKRRTSHSRISNQSRIIIMQPPSCGGLKKGPRSY